MPAKLAKTRLSRAWLAPTDLGSFLIEHSDLTDVLRPFLRFAWVPTLRMGTQRLWRDTPSYSLNKHPRGWLRPSTLRRYKATLLINYRLSIATTLAEKLFALPILGDDRAVKETYAAGVSVHRKEA